MNYRKISLALGLMLVAIFAMAQTFSGTFNLGFVQRAKPAATSDTRTAGLQQRLGRYGEIYALNVVPNKTNLADEGSYFVTGTTTSTSIGSPATIAFVAGGSTSFTATKAAFVIKNNDAIGGKRIYMDYLKLFNWGTAPTSTVSVNLAAVLDSANRTSTAGGGTLTVVNANNDDGTASIAIAQGYNAAGALLTVPAAGPTARQVTQCMLKSQIPVVRDSLECYFGAVDGTGGTMGTTGGRFVSNGAPLIIGPQQYAVFHIWAPSATVDGTAEYELAWWER